MPVTAAEKMIDISSEMRKDAMEKLDDIRRKHKLLYKKSQKLLDETIPAEDSSQHEGRSEPLKDSLQHKWKDDGKGGSKIKRSKKSSNK